MFFAFVLFSANSILAQSSNTSEEDKSLPVVISAPKPAYPTKALLEKADGDVQVDVKIDSKGKVTKAVFVGGNEVFKEAVLKTALLWKFNETVQSTDERKARLTFTYYLNDDNYEKPNVAEIKYQYRLKIFFINPGTDCFNDCDKTKN